MHTVHVTNIPLCIYVCMYVCMYVVAPSSRETLLESAKISVKLTTFITRLIYMYVCMYVCTMNRCFQVDASTKALQGLATICSCLRYFGHVIVGVSRTNDRLLLIEKVQFLSQDNK